MRKKRRRRRDSQLSSDGAILESATSSSGVEIVNHDVTLSRGVVVSKCVILDEASVVKFAVVVAVVADAAV